MAKAKDIHDHESVTAFIQQLEPAFGELVETLRQLILSADAEIGEQIKWNSPAFFYQGQMKPFNPKEYKRDIVVMNIRKGVALLVFPTGAAIPDGRGILEGNYTDGRRLCTFNNLEDVAKKGKELQDVIRQWLAMIDK